MAGTMQTQDGLSARWARRAPEWLTWGTVAPIIILGIIAFLVVYPVWLLLLNSFDVDHSWGGTAWGLDNWRTALTHPRMQSALINTFTLAVTRQAVAFVLGVLLAWLIARTNLPGRNWLEFGFWVALFLPALPVLMGWLLLLDGRGGLMNVALAKLPFVNGPVFSLYSWWGIVFMHLMTGTLAVKVFLLTPAFRNLDAALEEASRTSGASTFTTLFRIVVPLMMPAIMVVMLIGMIRSMQAFEIELILGSQDQIEVYSTVLYYQVQNTVPRYGIANALSIFMLAVLVPFIIGQQWLSRRRSHATVSGKFTRRPHDLGKWKWPAFWAIVALLMFMTVVPSGLLLLGSFMKIFGYWNLPEPYTLKNWTTALASAGLSSAFKNTMLLGGGAALLGVMLYSSVAYISVRTKFFARGTLDFLTWVPTTIPGIVISLGLLWLFVGMQVFRPIYGTTFILIIAVVLGNMTVGVQIIKTSMMQLGAELEEASWAAGGGRLYTFWRIVLPLVLPAMAVVVLQVFASAVSVVALVALLGSASNKPMSLLQLDHLESGNLQAASVVGVLILLITVGAALAARILGLRTGLNRG